MRQLLFKAKTTPKESGEFNNVWTFGDLIQSNGKYYIHPQCNRVNVKGEIGKLIVMHEIIPETICQYTGLKDKDGHEIYENDFLGSEYNKVEFVSGEWCINGDTPLIFMVKENNVVGNKFDNYKPSTI